MIDVAVNISKTISVAAQLTGITVFANPPVPLIYAYPQPTGAPVSYYTRDDKWVQDNYFTGGLTSGKIVQLLNFFTLKESNIFGNTTRFTDSKGGQVYGVGNGSLANYVIDNYQGLAIYRIASQAIAANAFAASLNPLLGFSDWFIPNINQLNSIAIRNNTVDPQPLNYAPFNVTTPGIPICSSTTRTDGTSNLHVLTYPGGIGIDAKVNSNFYILMRKI